MRAAVYHEFEGPITVTDVPEPKPGPDEVVLRVMATGICRSDWHGWKGHDADISSLPHVPGHEMAGEIAEVGIEVTGWEPGDRVTIPFVAGCGRCATCQAGDPQVCPNQSQPGFTHWGSFAELAVIRYAEHNLVRLPDDIDYVSAAALGCRFATAYRAVVQQGRLKPDEWVAVYGCGGVGSSAVMIAASLGARVIAVDTNPEALELAMALGARTTVDAQGDITARVIEASDGGAHLGIDALGSSTLVRQSMGALRRRGRHVQVGLLVGEDSPTPLHLDRVVAYELEVIGSHGIARASFSEIFDLVLNSGIDLSALVNHEVTLDQGAHRLQTFDEHREPGVAVISSFVAG